MVNTAQQNSEKLNIYTIFVLIFCLILLITKNKKTLYKTFCNFNIQPSKNQYIK